MGAWPEHESDSPIDAETLPTANRMFSVPWGAIAGIRDPTLLFESRDDGSCIGWVNEAFVTLSRYAPSDVVGHGIEVLLTEPADTALFRALWLRLDDTPLRAAVSLRAASNNHVPVEIELIPLVTAGPRCCLVILHDMSADHEAVLSVDRAHQRLRLASDVGRIGTWEWKPATGELTWDRWLRFILGVTDAETATHARWTELMHPPDRARAAADAQFLLAGALDEVEARYRIDRPDGTYRHVLARTRVSERDTRGVASCLIGVLLDITELHQAAEEREVLFAAERRARAAAERANQELTRLASSDPLTGLANRHELNRWINHALTQDERIAVLFFDVDRFKPINDSHGHNVGDYVLIELASRLRERIRPTDLVARFGGDEFIVATVVANEAEATRLAHRLLEDMAKPIVAPNLQVTTTASVGLALSDQQHPADAESLLSDADIALYHAKRQGRNCAVWYHPSHRSMIVK